MNPMIKFATDSDPICSAESDIKTDTRLLHCTVNFTGSWYPRMEWRSSNGILMKTCDEQSVSRSESTLSLRCDVVVTAGEGGVAQCRTFFTAAGWRDETPIPDATYSRHVPSYNHTCRHLGELGALTSFSR